MNIWIHIFEPRNDEINVKMITVKGPSYAVAITKPKKT